MQQVVEHTYTEVTTEEIIQKVKEKLAGSLSRLEQAVVGYQHRNTMRTNALVEELDDYLGQLQQLIGEEEN
jgi:hypothetical protein